MSTVTERRVTGSEWWDYHSVRSAAALQWYTDPHLQVLFPVFVIALTLSRRLAISLASLLVVGITTINGMSAMQMAAVYPLLLL